MSSPRRIIIQNESILDDHKVLPYVAKVIEGGKVSIDKGEPCYCFVTRWKFPNHFALVVIALPNKMSDRFIVRNEPWGCDE